MGLSHIPPLSSIERVEIGSLPATPPEGSRFLLVEDPMLSRIILVEGETDIATFFCGVCGPMSGRSSSGTR